MRWGEPHGDEMEPLDAKLVRETAEAVLGPALRELEGAVEALRQIAEPSEVDRPQLHLIARDTLRAAGVPLASETGGR